MKRTFIPALGLQTLTPLYDPLVAITTRERAFKSALIRLAAVKPGLDVDGAMLARACRKARSAGTAVDFVRGRSSAVPWPDHSFDKVVSSLFFDHLDSEAAPLGSIVLYRAGRSETTPGQT